MTPAELLVIKLGAWPFTVMWVAWLTFWGVSARKAKQNAGVESRASSRSHILPAVLGCLVLVATQPPGGFITPNVWPFSVATYTISFVMSALGLAFTVWARVHLGANWSADVARKVDPDLIRSGPYAHVRHPIYSGLLLAFLGIAVGRGDVAGLLGSALMGYAFVRKMRIEEEWLQQTFGQAYTRYRAEVPSLLPRPLKLRHG